MLEFSLPGRRGRWGDREHLLTQSDNYIIQRQEKTNLAQLSSNVSLEVTSRFTADVLETLRYVAKRRLTHKVLERLLCHVVAEFGHSSVSLFMSKLCQWFSLTHEFISSTKGKSFGEVL